MSIFEPLTEENFLLFASKYYFNSNCISLDEFYEDVKRISYIKKLINRYKLNDDLQERLILNHLIIIYNSFGIYASTKMIFYKLNKEDWSIIKTFLIFLNYIKSDDFIEVEIDQNILDKLKNL
jgi:hypothetical protein